jgi:hypothetical protein
MLLRMKQGLEMLALLGGHAEKQGGPVKEVRCTISMIILSNITFAHFQSREYEGMFTTC